jgi:hypothetical protein
MAKPKMKFEVLENETIDECVDRIKKQGYSPIRRIEKPIFQETEKNGQKTYEPAGRQIIFEAIQID